ncbi:MAG: YhbY family RNA-binding protein [Betaproteobacteria bacterium]
MASLNPSQRRTLRAKAHHLHPVVFVGNHGLTPAVLHEIDVNLMAHELVKLRMFSDDRAERETVLARICAELDAAPVQHLGKVLVVYRARPEEPAPEPKPGAREKRRAVAEAPKHLYAAKSVKPSGERTRVPASRVATKGRASAVRGAAGGPIIEGGRRGRAIAAPRTPKKTGTAKAFGAGKAAAAAYQTPQAPRPGRSRATPAGPRPPQQRRRRG